ncbi:Os08g0294800 [Oryza sativa Japonica Group]|nr:Os08g0294800 [Oryza sativa Japonica Group]
MYVISVRSNVYSLSKWTQEWASEFIARNIDTMRNNTNGQLLDSGYSNLVESVRTNVNVPHTAVEVNLLQTIMSAPSADHHQNAADQVAAPAAQPFSAAPPVALPPKAAPRKARKDRDYASMLVAVEEFYVAATSRPVPNSDVEILESSHVSQQQDGGRAIIYPSLQARRGKTKQEVPRRNAKDVLEYLSLARKETEKEINTLSSFDGIYRNDGTLSYLMTEVRRLNRKIWRLQKNAPSTLSSRLLASVKEIDDIKVEKGRLYAQFISALKKLCRKKMDDGGSAPSANN